MPNEPTSGDYAWSEARDNAKAIRDLEARIAILEGICRVVTVADPLSVEAAIGQIKIERDDRNRAETERIRQLEEARLPERQREMREAAKRYGMFSGHRIRI